MLGRRLRSFLRELAIVTSLLMPPIILGYFWLLPKIVERAIRDRELRTYARAAEAGPTGMIVISSLGRIEVVNAGFAENLGYPPPLPVGMMIWDICAPESKAAMSELLAQLPASDNSASSRSQLVADQRDWFFVDASGKTHRRALYAYYVPPSADDPDRPLFVFKSNPLSPKKKGW